MAVNRVIVTVVASAIQRGCITLESLVNMKESGQFTPQDWNQFVELAGLEGKLTKAKEGDVSNPTAVLADPGADMKVEVTINNFGVVMNDEQIAHLADAIFRKLNGEGRLVGKGPMVSTAIDFIAGAIRELVTVDNTVVAPFQTEQAL